MHTLKYCYSNRCKLVMMWSAMVLCSLIGSAYAGNQSDHTAKVEARPNHSASRSSKDTMVSKNTRKVYLELRFTKHNFTPREPITMSAIIHNNSMHGISYVRVMKGGILTFDVHRHVNVEGERRERMPLTRYGQRANRSLYNSGFGAVVVRIKPGQSHTSNIILDRFVDMTLHGTYSVEASITVTHGNKTLKLTSQTVQVLIHELQRPLKSNNIVIIDKGKKSNGTQEDRREEPERESGRK